MSTVLAEWAAVVDSIAKVDSRDPLPSQYNPEDFLPQPNDASSSTKLPALTDAFFAQLRQEERKRYNLGAEEEEGGGGEAAPFEMASARLFRSQMSMEESLHVKPALHHFSSEVAQRARDSASPVSNILLDPAGHHDGPDYLNVYRNASSVRPRLEQSATPSSTRALASGKKDGSMPSMRAEFSTRLSSGFLNPRYIAAIHRQPDFMPIILVPPNITAPIQLLNVKAFLETGILEDPIEQVIDKETGATSVRQVKPAYQVVSSALFRQGISARVAFTKFRVLDDPAMVDDWNHVCAALVSGDLWQFDKWFPAESRRSEQATKPSAVFHRIAGFLAYFEENKIPSAVREWNVHPLILTKRSLKAQQHIQCAAAFWERLFQHLDGSPFFSKFTVPLEG